MPEFSLLPVEVHGSRSAPMGMLGLPGSEMPLGGVHWDFFSLQNCSLVYNGKPAEVSSIIERITYNNIILL